MSRPLPIALAQATPVAAAAPLSGFAAEVETLAASLPRTALIAYPELHLCGVSGTKAERDAQLHAVAEPLSGPRAQQLAELAGDLGVWLLPGSVCERGENGELFNTALAFSPQGELAASYRKVFPWRPYEPYDPGDRFVVFDAAGIGRLGFSICYDAWFPETARQLAWLGAEVIVNPVQTTTTDRAQELVLARANAIMNQVFVLSVNAAGPVGTGHSLVVDPEGHVRAEAPGSGATLLTDVLDLDAVARTREFGTAGLNRMWAQFTDADAPLELPLYQGRIEARRWTPATPEPPR
ncbi:carbon-nitrogen hydrolase family protein [Saccharopolyspora sp. K220]|uniref:carbon-nitrogen hydrolase family protein n=1 Tax=Saccharopolyspora soli TaxID=2926618 RepID=UPI001F569C31|nr:carbon-nitrogen hydrolase family protein [Saccharopolyspora soli]MCI2423718.1 carbon-nitrogen hydrolase family protein [Saccharopolyspora soli]